MRTLKLFRRWFLATCLILAAPFPAWADDDAAAFIANLGEQGIAVMRAQETQEARREEFQKLFSASFDVPAVGKFVLGRHWRVATPEQQAQYLNLFERYVIIIYSERFDGYEGEQFQVRGESPGDHGEITVNSEVIRPGGGQPVRIDWRVEKTNGVFKITDVMVEGVSMAQTQRQEFSSVIMQNGGKVQALLDILAKKVAGL
ncbi:MAG: ABC transporter substrate-binding protein [Rhodospirillaceae bacterium]|nr:ABC transporter substrate-binding protein [Rhodospirillaceae bacterium]MEA4836772.1 ABC transporter substrate-binding protein [Rhodospirillaceae bacterium]